MMRNHEVDQTTLAGHEYEVDEDSTLYVFPGVAFMEAPVGSSDAPYVFSIAPTKLGEMTDGVDGTPVERTVYKTSSRMYITAEYDAPPGVVDYLVNDIAYEYEETFLVYNETPHEYDDPAIEGTEYIRLRNGWSDVQDLCLPKEDFESQVAAGEVLRLWPVWECAHR